MEDADLLARRETTAEEPRDETGTSDDEPSGGDHQRAPQLQEARQQESNRYPTYSGRGDRGGQNCEDWLDKIKIVASVFNWDEKTQLAHLVSCVRGIAQAFYRTCTPKQKHSYATLKELLQCFTPVHVQSVQASLFHHHHQKPSETVDDYAQALWILFRRAFPNTDRECSVSVRTC